MPGRHQKTWTLFCPRCKWYKCIFATREYIYEYVLVKALPHCRDCKARSDITIKIEVLEGEHASGITT